ncbi:MAG: cobyric acid synthase [Alphaproteobacteria bacterium]|nr:cobyric acid synthase [Alphaproteobacteria bacterium]
MSAKAIMFLGTGSDVGKSLIVAGLARAFANRGFRVAPFKPQNMSNNAAVTSDGGEIGRAQALQARAARIPATVHMNPVLLKPESETGAQVIVQGKRKATLKASDFFRDRAQFMPAILESFHSLAENHDLILVEGAGSPAEVNLRNGDLANLGFAKAAQIPALLIGDIHRGGVIASIIGTFAVLSEDDRNHIKGFLINKFHGDVELFSEGKLYLENHTKTPCLGVVPHFAHAARLPAEDAVTLEHMGATDSKGLNICVLRLPRIANFDDLDPLRLEPDVTVQFLNAGEPIPADAKLVIIPGSKSTIADLKALRAAGWHIDLKAHVRRGGRVLGLCGGYQMLGRMIHDPQGLEGPATSVEGLGLLDVETTLLPNKTTTETQAIHALSGQLINAYEIHLGETAGPDCQRLFAQTANGPEGATSPDLLVTGTYLHGCFAADGFRHSFLKALGANASSFAFDQTIEQTLDGLATHLETHLDLDQILALAGDVT